MRKYLIGLTFITMLLACSEEGALPEAKQKSKMFALFQQNLLNFRNGNSSSFSTIGTNGLNFSDPFDIPGSGMKTEFVIDGIRYTVESSFCFFDSYYGYTGIGGQIPLGDNETIDIVCYLYGYPNESETIRVGYYSDAYVGITHYHREENLFFEIASYSALDGFVDFEFGNGLLTTFSDLVLEDNNSYSTIQAEGQVQCAEIETF